MPSAFCLRDRWSGNRRDSLDTLGLPSDRAPTRELTQEPDWLRGAPDRLGGPERGRCRMDGDRCEGLAAPARRGGPGPSWLGSAGRCGDAPSRAAAPDTEALPEVAGVDGVEDDAVAEARAEVQQRLMVGGTLLITVAVGAVGRETAEQLYGADLVRRACCRWLRELRLERFHPCPRRGSGPRGTRWSSWATDAGGGTRARRRTPRCSRPSRSARRSGACSSGCRRSRMTSP
ncbi:hypothetical protein GCM10018772_25100 [Streptomyces fumanus]|uniref:Uncharacterized protein n=1 Tax=Streptomyces fumanus TaxID=67302 RepID=A0A919ACC8_9ACTN|nr:hypothetical protein GCM10018772_25100 [Streptomyces fumanus]